MLEFEGGSIVGTPQYFQGSKVKDNYTVIDKKTGGAKLNSDGTPKAKTSHTLNKVPCIVYDNTDAKNHYTVKADEGNFGLSNVAATMVNLMGYKAPEMWNESIIDVE